MIIDEKSLHIHSFWKKHSKWARSSGFVFIPSPVTSRTRAKEAVALFVQDGCVCRNGLDYSLNGSFATGPQLRWFFPRLHRPTTETPPGRVLRLLSWHSVAEVTSCDRSAEVLLTVTSHLQPRLLPCCLSEDRSHFLPASCYIFPWSPL